ncbi:PP2C family protein-serine/threonine phosphatase [Streptomyces sp. NPDC047461]|uniref:PP2C family protein-serine/threonine phosphatase n=1 Tax=Streptomyces sp. NPDC047461 TaxID=3155619 RepID=UPI0033EAF8A0
MKVRRRRSMTAVAVSTALAVEVIVALAAALTELPLSGLLLLGPLLVAHRLSARATAAMSGTAVGVALLVSPPTDACRLATFCTVVAGGGWAIDMVRSREHAGRALARTAHLADTVQRALARPLPERLGNLVMVTYTRCAVPFAQLGGDVHDAVLTAAGPRLLVADVKGHDVEAIPAAAALLAAFRHNAATEPDPVRLARVLDDRIRADLGPEDFVTLLLVDFHPGEVHIVNCGHPPPLRVGRRLEALSSSHPSPPLGLGPDPRPQRVKLAPGQRLLLYTDGLTETRDANHKPFSVDHDMHAALTAPDPHEAMRRLTERFRRHTADAPVTDDLTLVLVQPSDGPVTATAAPESGPRGLGAEAGPPDHGPGPSFGSAGSRPDGPGRNPAQ